MASHLDGSLVEVETSVITHDVLSDKTHSVYKPDPGADPYHAAFPIHRNILHTWNVHPHADPLPKRSCVAFPEHSEPTTLLIGRTEVTAAGHGGSFCVISVGVPKTRGRSVVNVATN